MRRPAPSAAPRLLTALALTLALACVGAPAARAQTSAAAPATDQPAPPKPPSGGPAAAHAHPQARKTPAKPPPGLQAAPVAKPAAPAPPVVPAAPPPAPVLPPPIVVPVRQPPPPAPAPVTPGAPGEASATADGLRITFGSDRADLNPESHDAIVKLAHGAAAPDSSFTVTAYATGGDDPSMPRRLSLSRALAVRSALIEAGIASVRIYVKALGASSPAMAEGPPDRVDVVVAAGPAPAPAATPAPAAGSAPIPVPPPGQTAPWGQRPDATQSGMPATAPVPTQKADP